MNIQHKLAHFSLATAYITLLLTIVQVAVAEELTYHLEIRDHLFYPDTLSVPSGVRFKLTITNKDAAPEEFESFELNREKVVMGNNEATLFVGPLKPGTYPFFGEFNPESAQGKFIAVPTQPE